MEGQPSQNRCSACGAVQPIGATLCSNCKHLLSTQVAPAGPVPPLATVVPGQSSPGLAIGQSRHFASHIAYPNQGNNFPPPLGYVQKSPGTHSMWLAVLLSFLCGQGIVQLYNGQLLKGALFIVVGSLVIGFTNGWVAGAIWILSGIDVIRIAWKLRRGQAVGPWEFF